VVHIVSFQIPHDISSGPLEVERFEHLHSAFKLLTSRYTDEFAVSGLFKYSRYRPIDLSRHPHTLSIDHEQRRDQNDVRDYCQDSGFFGR